MKNEQMQYQVKKTVRFKLKTGNKNAKSFLENKKDNIKINDNDLLINFCNILNDLIEKTKIYIYEQQNFKSLHIKKDWLFSYVKNEFYESDLIDKNIKQYNLKDLKFLKEIFKIYIANIEQLITTLKEKASKNENELPRKTEFGLLIRQISNKKGILFLTDFIKNSINKNTNENIELEKLTNIILIDLEKWKNYYLPSQTNGLLIAKASFNYFTINKHNKEFYEKELDVENRNYNKTFYVRNQNDWNDVIFYNSKKISKNLNIECLYKTLKLYKAEQKSLLLEKIKSKDINFEQLKTQFPLFECDESNWNSFVICSTEISTLSNKINIILNGRNFNELNDDNKLKIKDLKDEIKIKKQSRGDKYFGKDKEGIFKKYSKFCKFYKKVAQQLGSIKAKIKGLEIDKIDSQLLEYWALIHEENNRKKLVLINRSDAKEIYTEINIANTTNTDNLICFFESITYRALYKLCFKKNNNTFLQGIKNDLNKNKVDICRNEAIYWKDNKYELSNSFGIHKFLLDTDKKGEYDYCKLIHFFKIILETDYVKKYLKLPNDQIKKEIIEIDFKGDINAFKIALEKICYKKYIVINENLKSKILNKGLVFDICSLDLDKNTNKNLLKNHTKLWLNFWDKNNENTNFTTRINPELSILYREPKESRVEKYKDGIVELNGIKKQMQNRYLFEHITLQTNLTLNALNIENNLAFSDINKEVENINSFNEKLNENLAKSFNNNFFYGIDVGEKELATIALGKLVENKFITQTFKVYKIKIKKDFNKANEIEKRIIKNPSFITDDNLLESFDTSSIDLTTAKLVKGKIIINGDFGTLLNLKILNAKRKIYQQLIKNPNTELCKHNYKIYFKNENNPIYHSIEEFEYFIPFDKIFIELNDFLHNENKNEFFLEEKINHVRNSLTGNAVGIIHFLFQKFPGYISMEGFFSNINKIESDRKKFEGSITKPLEYALYRKFQIDGLVPVIKNLFKLRYEVSDNKKIKQFGIINFIDEKSTSKSCPYCFTTYIDNNEFKEDKIKSIFKCSNCGYHNIENSKGLIGLNSNDSVAAFNIAKNGCEFIKNMKIQHLF